MSNVLTGEIHCTDVRCAFYNGFSVDIVRYAVDHGFGITFTELISTPTDVIQFIVSEDFLDKICDVFLQPIAFRENGDAGIQKCRDDIFTIEGLIRLIFSFDFVEYITIRLSDADAQDSELHCIEVEIDDFSEILFSEYMKRKNDVYVPFLKINIYR